MYQIDINTDSSKSKIIICNSLEMLNDLICNRSVVAITDENVFTLYPDMFKDIRTIVIRTGEEIKTLDTVEYILNKLIEYNTDRNSFLLGVGGGVVTDITGFAASVYMRGIRFGYVSTTLLGQVDASIGGKNGVNFSKLKNIVGVFNQPEFVISNVTMLKTLPLNEIRSGIAEIIKAGLIDSTELLDMLENDKKKILSIDETIIEKVVYLASKVKIDIVQKDEFESDLRKLLNFGHTIGHAVEMVTGCSHGEGVSVGMAAAVDISLRKKYTNALIKNRIVDLLKSYGLPTEINTEVNDIAEKMIHDKKNEKSLVNFVFIKDICKLFTEKVPLDELINFLNKE